MDIYFEIFSSIRQILFKFQDAACVHMYYHIYSFIFKFYCFCVLLSKLKMTKSDENH